MSKNILRMLLSAGALSAGWLGLSGLPLLVALVPLLLISREAGPSRRDWWRTAGWCAAAFGLWSALTTWWIWHAAPIGAILSVLITAVLCGGSFMFYHYVSRRSREALGWVVLVCSWIAAEYWYTVGEVSFPWLMLGNGFARDVWAVQWYEFTGIFGGTLWVLLCNILVYRFVCQRTAARGAAAAAAVAVPLLLSALLWIVRADEGAGGAEGRSTAEITVVQPDVDPYGEKFSVSQSEQTKLLLSLAAGAPQGTGCIVMPETAVDDFIVEGDSLRGSLAAMQRFLAGRPGCRIVTGATTRRLYAPQERTSTARMGPGYWYDIYNSALLLGSSGQPEIHHKSKLVVGVEKMPYPKLMERLEFLIVDLGGTTGQLGVDSRRKVFDHPEGGYRLGTAICYESVYGDYFAEFVRGGAQVMAVITNDGWWGDTPGYRQHFSFARLRAIETRRAIARSANTGISGFVDPRGRVVQSLGWDLRGTLSAALPLNDRVTFYVRYGDFVARAALYVLILSVLYFIAYRTRRKDHLVD